MSSLPSGTVTFLFTDIEGSTKLAQEYHSDWESLRARHHAIMNQAAQAHDGHVFQIVGDEFCIAFHTALDAVLAAADAQRMLFTEPWKPAPIKVRMGIHTGTALVGNDPDGSVSYTGYTTLARTARLMSSGHGGQVLVSLATEELIRDELPADFGLRNMGSRRLKDLIHSEQIFQLIIPSLSADFPPLKTLDVYRHNLPIQLSTFIGREKELAEVRQALMEHRLVTLTGTGGTGKTRLSLHVAADLLDHFSNGVWFVDLASITNPALIPQTILSAFGICDQPGMTSLQLLNDYVRERNLLLVVDNCEHLISETAKLVTNLLASSENLKILATSREALGVDGELNWYVPSLTLPDIHHLPPIEALSQYEAVNLFIDRATLAQPHFTVTNDNAPAIAQICYRLDGIPLAIELAAARVKILDVEQINKRLDNRFHLLTDGSRTSLPRHQTLRATIDWSYELLSDQEKVLFRRLAVFTGGWTLEAAEQVCNVEESPMDIFDALAHLVDKSLVIMDSSTGEARHHMLETTRQYAHEKLLASNEREVLRNRHYDWYFELAECGKRELQGANQLLWLHRLDSELDNLRSALEWAFASSRRDTKGMQMVCNLMEFWDYSSYFSEGFAWLEKAEKESLAFMETPIRAKILYHYGYWTTLIKGNWKAGRSLLVESLETFRKLGIAHRLDLAYTESWLGYFLYFRDNEHETGCIYLKEAIEIFQEAGERRGHGWALNLFSEVKSYERDIKTALAMAEEGVALYTSCGDRLGTAICGLQLGFCNMRPGAYAYEKAIRFMGDALEVFKEFGSRMWISLTLNSLGEAHRGLREYDEAEACYRESLFVQKEACMMPNWFIGNRLGLGYAVLYRGDNDQATLIFKEALVLSKKHKREVELIHSLAGCAAVAAAKGNAEDSALLYGAVDYLFQKFLANGEKLDSLIDPTDSREFERYQALCRSKLGNSAFESALRRGYGITLDQAITFALEQVDR